MIARTGNVRKASELLLVTQPALSRQLRNLEEELGLALFERMPRGLKLNAAGLAYAKDVERLLADVEAAGERARRITSGEAGSLRLGFLEVTAWTGVVPETFKAFTSAHPDVRVELTSANTFDQLRMLEEGRLDGGFVYPFGDLPRGLTCLCVRTGTTVLAYPAHWSDRIGQMCLAKDLVDLPFIGFPRESHPRYHDLLVSMCHEAGLICNVVQYGGHEGEILSLVSAGVGVAIVNDANRDRPPAGVGFAFISDLRCPLDLYFVCKENHCNPALQSLLQMMASGFTCPPVHT